MGKNTHILFVEKSLKLLKPGGDLYIVLPEGLMNLNRYQYFRKWLLEKAFIVCSISLPEGAFIPFGGSVSKTCIVGLRKKDEISAELYKPQNVFLGRAVEIGYETGKKTHKKKEKNDLAFFMNSSKEIFGEIKSTDSGGECGWIDQSLISPYRIDASYLLNKVDREQLKLHFEKLVPLKDVCEIENIAESIKQTEMYNYLEVPDISSETGTISNIRYLRGSDITANSLYKFFPDDILFTRINPRKSRVTIVPKINNFGVVSKEVYRIKIKENNPYISEKDKYILVPLLQSTKVKNQIVRMSSGSSSSRARVQPEDLLNDVYIPILKTSMQSELSTVIYNSNNEHWYTSQNTLDSFVRVQNKLGNSISKENIRSV